jgi:hypothetical protein
MRGAIWLVLALGGCSVVFVDGPPKYAEPNVDCTESRAAPIADAVLAAGFGVASIAAFASHSTSSCNPNDNNQDFCVSGSSGAIAGTVLLLPTAIFALSAIHGASATGDCRDLHAQRVPTLPGAPAPTKPWNPDAR